jgi:hypothetical protein
MLNYIKIPPNVKRKHYEGRSSCSWIFHQVVLILVKKQQTNDVFHEMKWMASVAVAWSFWLVLDDVIDIKIIYKIDR